MITSQKRYRRVLSRGERISPESPADDLHAHRIDAKKLRYLLEFFRSLFDGRNLRSSLKTLKALQDNLGGMLRTSRSRQP